MPPKDSNGTAKSVNALLDLLTTAGLDTVDNSLLDREAERCVIELRQSRDSLPDDPQAWDRQVEKLIRQLRESLRDTPERDIEKEPEMLTMQHRQQHNMPQPHPQPAPDFKPPRQQEDPAEDRRQYLEREFSSTSYPKIGPGYSDSISVVSDLTIPTVVNGGEPVPEEEKYPQGPPLSIGFTPKPRSQLRRPSLENKNGGGSRHVGSESSSGEQKDRRAAQQHLRPPSRRVVTRPGGAAANRRQNHQMTMAHLKATTPEVQSRSSKSGEQKATPAPSMSVNDFPSLKDASRGGSEDAKLRRGSERRSLLRKSNKYAASVSATASQRMLLARQEDAKKKRSNRRQSTGNEEGFAGTEGFSPAGAADDFGFDNMEAAEESVQKGADPVLIDEDGFIIGAEPQADPFAAAAFNADFPPTSSFSGTFNSNTSNNSSNNNSNTSNTSSNNNSTSNSANNSFFPASSKDTKKKKSNSRKASMTGKTPPGKLKKKDDTRIDAVERATKKKLDILRRAAEQQGDSEFGNKVDAVEQETMKQIRRIRDHYKQGRDE